MTQSNSFGAASTLTVGGSQYKYYALEALQKRGVNISRIPYSIKILLENLLRSEDGATVKASDIEYVAAVEDRRSGARDQLPSGARAAAGFHRRALRGGSGRDARRAARDGRRSQARQSADPRRSGDRSFRAGGRVRHRRAHSASTRCSNSSAIRSATHFCAGARRRFRIFAWCRPIPASCTR